MLLNEKDCHINRNFGHFLREKREGQGYGLRELSRAIKISPTYLSRIENGHENAPSDDIMKRLSKILNVQLGELYIVARRVPRDVQTELSLHHKSLIIDLINKVMG